MVPPELGGFLVQRIDEQGSAAHQLSSRHRTRERVAQQPRPDTSASPFSIRGQLAKQETRYRVWRLACAHGARNPRRRDSGRRKAVVAHDSTRVMHDHDDGESFLLIGQSACSEP